jgi:hypothetical protein
MCLYSDVVFNTYLTVYIDPFYKFYETKYFFIISDEWKYKQKLVVFEDANGNRVTPTTTVKTTTTKKPEITTSVKNVTKYTQPTEFTSVAVVTTAGNSSMLSLRQLDSVITHLNKSLT